MIKQHKLKQLLFLLLLIPSTFLVGLSKVDATSRGGQGGGGGFPGGDGVGNGADGGHDTGADSRTPTYGSKCDSVICNISHSYYAEQNINIDIKRQDGTIIQEDLFSQDFSEEFLAGTSVMLRVYETQKFTTTASYTVSAKRQVWTCKEYEPRCEYENKKGECVRWVKVLVNSYDSDCVCPSGEPSFKGWRDVTSEYIASCSAAAVPAVITLTPSYTALYEDSNDIDAEPSDNKYYTAETIEGFECEEPVKGTTPGVNGANGYSSANTLSGECSTSYDRVGKICINVKNSKVRYISEDDECEEPDEYTVTQDKDGYWKYFIPLNANSADDFVFTLSSSKKQKALAVICQDYIDKYDDYAYWITDSNGNSFIGQNISKAKAKRMVENGCYFQTTAVIPVIQRFYNELGEDTENVFEGFKGFNFYYRPIDPDNPFPNGLTNTSIWYDWNESDVKEPDLTESYNGTPTYVAYTSGNEKSIRQYNALEEYTSWENMYVSGVSEFIEKENIIQRNVDKDSFYALGCGPTNSISDVDNVFYQLECDKS